MSSQFDNHVEFEEELKHFMRHAHEDLDNPCGAYYVSLNDDTGYQIEITEVEM
jgi:hypothetical protein